MMMRDSRLLFGPLGAALLLVGVAGLPLMIPGYDAVRQTVSEIGEVGSPAQFPFTALLCLVALCIVVFAAGLARRAADVGVSRWPAWVTAVMALSAAGVGVFAYPHPLHNVFGLSELIGYQAPLALWLTWRGRPAAGFSAAMAAVVSVMIALNLVSLFRDPVVWPLMKPVYGLVQRGLFAAWFAWAAGVGLMLRRDGHPQVA
jgi:hypothetical membrane protein